MKKSNMRAYITYLGFLIFGVGVSYMLALAGEPQSAWLYCEVLNLCP